MEYNSTYTPCLAGVHECLYTYGVEVYFEEQKFGSLDPEAELMISLYCGVAEGENKSHSEDVR